MKRKIGTTLLVVSAAMVMMVACTSRPAPAPATSSNERPATGAQLIPASPTAVAFQDPQHGWVGGADGIWKTDDGGKTWTQQFYSREPVVQLNLAAANHVWALTQSSILAHSSDGGRNWTQTKTTGPQYRIIDFVSSTFGAATDGNSLFVSRDGGVTWDQTDGTFPFANLDFVSEQEGWAAGHGEVRHTSDGGKTWNVQLTLSEQDLWLGRTYVRFTSKMTGWVLFCLGQGAASQEPYLLYGTHDGGQTWMPQLIGRWLFNTPVPKAPNGPGGYPIALAAEGENAWVVVDSPAAGYLEVVRLTGEGSSPVLGRTIPVAGSQRPTVGLSFANADTGWLVIGGVQRGQGTIFRSEDGGSSWTVQSGKQ